ITMLDKAVVDNRDRNPGWTTTASNLDAAEWETNWKAACKAAWLEEKDMGIKKAIEGVQKAMADKNYGDKTQDKQGQRKIRIDARDQIIELVGLLNQYWGQVGDCQGLRDYIEVLKDKGAEEARALQKKLHEEFQWSNPLKGMQAPEKFTSAGFTKVWTAA